MFDAQCHHEGMQKINVADGSLLIDCPWLMHQITYQVKFDWFWSQFLVILLLVFSREIDLVIILKTDSNTHSRQSSRFFYGHTRCYSFRIFILDILIEFKTSTMENNEDLGFYLMGAKHNQAKFQ